jgi:hypothetical protein
MSSTVIQGWLTVDSASAKPAQKKTLHRITKTSVFTMRIMKNCVTKSPSAAKLLRNTSEPDAQRVPVNTVALTQFLTPLGMAPWYGNLVSNAENLMRRPIMKITGALLKFDGCAANII